MGNDCCNDRKTDIIDDNNRNSSGPITSKRFDPNKPITFGLENLNPHGWSGKMDYETYVTEKFIIDGLKDFDSFRITSIRWYQLGICIGSLQLVFKNGLESPMFGIKDSKPNKEVNLPDKDIVKIDFHKGIKPKSDFSEGGQDKNRLGGLTIHFSDGTTQKIGTVEVYE